MSKIKITMRVHDDILKWIDKQINEDHKFATRTHAFEFAMYKLIRES